MSAPRWCSPSGGASPPCSRWCRLGAVRRVGSAVSVAHRRPADETVLCAAGSVYQQAGPSWGKPAASHQRYAQPTQGKWRPMKWLCNRQFRRAYVVEAYAPGPRVYHASQLNTAAVQLPIGLEDDHSGVVDVICGRAFQFSGMKGENVVEIPVPESMKVCARAVFAGSMPFDRTLASSRHQAFEFASSTKN